MQDKKTLGLAALLLFGLCAGSAWLVMSDGAPDAQPTDTAPGAQSSLDGPGPPEAAATAGNSDAPTRKANAPRPARGAERPTRGPKEEDGTALPRPVTHESGAGASPGAGSSGSDDSGSDDSAAERAVASAQGGASGRDERARAQRPSVTGIVFDQRTKAPLESVRVLFVLRRGEDRPWGGGTTNSEGRYQVVGPHGSDEPGAELEIRASKQGYRTAVVPTRGGELDIELEPRETPVLPGTVRGHATGPDGKPLTGTLLVTGSDETGSNAAQWTIAGEDGSFTLAGVPAGAWTFRLSTGGDQVRTNVPEDGETRIALSGPAAGTDDRLLARNAGYGSEYLDDRSLRKQVEQLSGEVNRMREQGTDPGRVATHLEELRAELAGRQIHRSVEIIAVPDDAGTTVRLEAQHPRVFWRAVAPGGTASFETVRGGTWTLVLARPGQPDLREPLMIPAGDGTFSAPAPVNLVERLEPDEFDEDR